MDLYVLAWAKTTLESTIQFSVVFTLAMGCVHISRFANIT